MIKNLLFAAAGNGGGEELPIVGQPYKGGYLAGKMNYGVPGEDYYLILFPGSTGSDFLVYKTTNTATLGTDSLFDGLANTNAMVTAGIDLHPLAKFCVESSNAGYNDWYMPARDEIELLYRTFKPTSASNIAGARPADAGGGSMGANANSVPIGAAYTTANPPMTAFPEFVSGGSQYLLTSYSSSTQGATDKTRHIVQDPRSANSGRQTTIVKAGVSWTRPVRRELILPE